MIDYTLPLDQLPDPLPIEPLTKPFDVTITPPGSKSITCRAYVLAALAKGESKLIRPLRADDTDLLLKALCTLGAEARWEGEDVFIKGVDGRFPRGGSVNLGDGGTPTRFMIACACLAAEPVTVDGSKRMRERPIAEGVEMLRQLGAKVDYVDAEGRLPVRVTPSDTFVGGRVAVGMTESSQFVSALLLIGASTRNGIRIAYTDRITSPSYVRLTHETLRRFGVPIGTFVFGDETAKEDRASSVQVRGGELAIPPDASSCAYWFTACALMPDARVLIPNLGRWGRDGKILNLDQPDLQILAAFSVEEFIFHEHHVGIVSSVNRPAVNLNAESMPDGAVALIAYCAACDGRSRITGLRTLRVKETDRIAALANELRKIGCEVATGEDWIEITPPALAGEKGGTGVSPVSGRRGAGEVLERRSRNLAHWELGGSTYFITFRVREGELSHGERRIVSRACRHWHDKRMTLHLGVVMHDHVHLLLTPLRSGSDADGKPRYHALSDLLHSFKSFTAHEIQRHRNAAGPFWQEESYDRIMRDDKEYLEKWNYILNNPAEAGLVTRGEEYEHFVRGDDSTGETPVPPFESPIIIETYNDHRMAMAFAVLGLVAPNGQRLAIRNPACVAKSYPTFWKDFAKLYQ